MMPEDWREAALGAIAEVRTGGTPRRDNAAFWGGEIPWMSSGEVHKREVWETDEKITEAALGASNARWIPEGSVMIALNGQGRTRGMVAILRRPMTCNQSLAAILPSASAASEYVFYSLQARYASLRSITGDAGRNGLNLELVRSVRLLLPPLPEQRKIAAILSSVDDAIEATKRVIDQLQVVKKAMMAELLTRGLPGRHKKFKMTEIGEVPEEWEVVRAGDVCSTITKGATPNTQTREAGEIPFLKVYNIDPDGFVDFTHQPTFIPRNTHDGELRRSRVTRGDVLMNIVGPPLGKVAVVPDGLPEANINQAIAMMRPTKVESRFLELCLSAEHLFSWALTRAKRTSTQLNLTLELCRDYPMPLPPSHEVGEILRLTEALKSRLHAEAEQLGALRATKEALLAVLLTGEVRVKPDKDAA